jgi:hypothetical protein
MSELRKSMSSIPNLKKSNACEDILSPDCLELHDVTYIRGL